MGILDCVLVEMSSGGGGFPLSVADGSNNSERFGGKIIFPGWDLHNFG